MAMIRAFFHQRWVLGTAAGCVFILTVVLSNM
jgi:hypothetical protein